MSKIGQVVSVNGELMPANEAMVSVFDDGLLTGRSVYETMRTYGQPLIWHLDWHISRLDRSLELLGITPSVNTKTIKKWLESYIKVVYESGQDRRIRLTVTPGGTPRYDIGGMAQSKVIIISTPVNKTAIEKKQTMGIRCVFSDYQRPLPEAKHTSMVTPLRPNGVDELLYVDRDGFVSEAQFSNVYTVKDKQLYVPTSSCLPGTMQRAVMAYAEDLKIPLSHQSLAKHDLKTADEVFLSNAVVGLYPVAELEGESCNPNAFAIMHQLQSHHRKVTSV